MDEALRTWMDQNTYGLLSDYVKEYSIDPETVLEIVSTLYYRAAWNMPFDANETTKETFHGTKGDTMADMMHQTYDCTYVYEADTYIAFKLWLSSGGCVCVYLPKEDISVDALIADADILAPVSSNMSSDQKWFHSNVHLSLPKFKVSSKQDLIETLKKQGVTDVFDEAASDFTPLTEKQGLFLSRAEHAAVLEIDEEGVIGAAVTYAVVDDALILKETYLVFDRPFLFVLAGRDGSVVFSGVIRNLE